ncbi:hypothetical protein [Phenylobacterium sp.]|uniref:hypothetical protein n=1 Tax=Phenylobacterium sp. TaxID=1871053 RepID=UPI0019B63CA9|nr:hypothetical protein [Phenylobacterium sp.]MBC7169025.1 hypothetical protein [Phenylobacterium sp.]
MPKQIIGAQGEITIIKVDAAPADFADMIQAEHAKAGWIISHSESGHHHVLTAGDVRERTKDVPQGMKVLYAILENPAQLIQDAQVPHGHYDLPAGVYEFRIAREYDPFAEQARVVAD